jgi:hypothetical protein
MRRRPTAFAALAAALLVPFVVAPASAELPADNVLLVRGASVESTSLPTLLNLPTGVYSTNELGLRFRQSAFGSNDLLALSTTDGSVRQLDDDGFELPANEATYYDPIRRTSYAARAIPAADGGALLSLMDGRTESVATLLAVNGAVLVFPTPVPEPGFALGLAIGVLALGARVKTHPERQALCL